LTGISYGGFGTWYLAHRYPQQFAAIAPVAGWGHPELMAPIAKNNIPLWVFAGGRDEIIHTHHFYAGLNCLEALGHSNVRFTVHADMGHDVWRRVYAGEDLFAWFLTHRIP
jgi:predicted peptidase